MLGDSGISWVSNSFIHNHVNEWICLTLTLKALMPTAVAGILFL